MYTVRNSYNEVILKKSKFITYLFKVDSIDEVKLYLDDLGIKYKDATHICYAYIIDSIKKCSDDGEPSKTAGMPILNILENNNLNHVICIVVRYFGGVKLGANGLIRAYSGCAKDIVKDNIISVLKGYFVSISFSYDKTRIVDNILRNCFITEKKYGDFVSYLFKVDINCYDKIYNDLLSICDSVNNIGECFLEKE